MKQLLALCLAVVCWASLAQQQPTCPAGGCVSPNLVYSTANPYNGPAGTQPYSWSGFTVTESTGGGVSGGNQPGYNTTTGTFMFGYTQSTIAYNYALSTALKNSGMSWLGYNYSWDYINQGMTKGTLSASLVFNGANGASLHSKNWTLDKTEGNEFTTISGTEVFTNPLAAANISSFDLKFSGKDDRFWAGYYGPQVKNISIKVNYTFDACSSNPLSSSDCPGYAQAYHDQQCAANPLYMSDCPGYAAAYQTQQCAANPLFATTCPGYAQAYFDQQCTISPLYNKDCTGYAKAYFDQQCTISPLYNKDCTGYAQAYFDQQCSLNGLYDRTCSNYAEAYAKTNLLSTTNTTTTTPVATTTATDTTQIASGIKDTTVSSVVAAGKDTTSATSPTSMISPISVIAPPKAPATESAITSVSISVQPTQAQQQERQQDQKKTDGAVASVERKAGGDRKEMAKAVGAAAKDAAEKAQKATTMEAQTANQGLVVGLMGYVPGFTAYQNAIVPDVLAQTVARQYMKPTVDNRTAQRGLSGANDQLHQRMVEQQYRMGN